MSLSSSGTDWPVSHLLTDCRDTSSLSASSPWDRFCPVRSFKIFSAKLIGAASLLGPILTVSQEKGNQSPLEILATGGCIAGASSAFPTPFPLKAKGRL